MTGLSEKELALFIDCIVCPPNLDSLVFSVLENYEFGLIVLPEEF